MHDRRKFRATEHKFGTFIAEVEKISPLDALNEKVTAIADRHIRAIDAELEKMRSEQ